MSSCETALSTHLVKLWHMHFIGIPWHSHCMWFHSPLLIALIHMVDLSCTVPFWRSPYISFLNCFFVNSCGSFEVSYRKTSGIHSEVWPGNPKTKETHPCPVPSNTAVPLVYPTRDPPPKTNGRRKSKAWPVGPKKQRKYRSSIYLAWSQWSRLGLIE